MLVIGKKTQLFAAIAFVALNAPIAAAAVSAFAGSTQLWRTAPLANPAEPVAATRATSLDGGPHSVVRLAVDFATPARAAAFPLGFGARRDRVAWLSGGGGRLPTIARFAWVDVAAVSDGPATATRVASAQTR